MTDGNGNQDINTWFRQEISTWDLLVIGLKHAFMTDIWFNHRIYAKESWMNILRFQAKIRVPIEMKELFEIHETSTTIKTPNIFNCTFILNVSIYLNDYEEMQ